MFPHKPILASSDLSITTSAELLYKFSDTIEWDNRLAIAESHYYENRDLYTLINYKNYEPDTEEFSQSILMKQNLQDIFDKYRRERLMKLLDPIDKEVHSKFLDIFVEHNSSSYLLSSDDEYVRCMDIYKSSRTIWI
jgi:hypothetical protein